MVDSPISKVDILILLRLILVSNQVKMTLSENKQSNKKKYSLTVYHFYDSFYKEKSGGREVMDYLYIILVIAVLGAAWWLLFQSEKKTKNKYKIEAYKLLDSPDATATEIKKHIKLLRLYGGRFRKDKEYIQLVEKLITKLDKIEPIKPIV
jgi:hypothetical protein